MEQFILIIDSFFYKYHLHKKGKIELNCDYGELVFIKDNNRILILQSIYIFPEYRKIGLCKNILHYLIDKSPNKFNYICIQDVLSKILYDYLLRFTYKGKKFRLLKDGFYYTI